MNQIINAFHPDYIKTYHPEFIAPSPEVAEQNAIKRKRKPVVRGPRESVHSAASLPMTVFPKTKAARSIQLAPREFHMYSKAGTANTKAKK
jgi:hypothetical protein